MFHTNRIQSLALSVNDVSEINTEEVQYDLAAPAPLPLPLSHHIFASPYALDAYETIQVSSREKILSLDENAVQISDFAPENPRERVPALLESPQREIDIINDIFSAIEANSSIEMIVEQLSLMRLPKVPPGDFGLQQELGSETEPSDVNTEVQVMRATFELVAILFGTHFQSQIELPHLYFEQENADEDERARHHTLRKWFEHYLYGYAQTHTDITEKVLSFIALGRFTEAAAIISEKRENRLALIVCAGRIVNWKEIFSDLNETEVINAELVLRALAGDLTAYSGYLCSWIELFAAALQKCETVEMACAEYAKVAGPLEDGHYLTELIRLYADKRRRRTIEVAMREIEAISFNERIPPLCGLIIGKFLVDESHGSSVFATPISYEQNQSDLRRITDKLTFRAALELFGQQKDEEALRLLELFKSFTAEKCIWCYAKICAASRENIDPARAIRYMGEDEWERIIQGGEEIEMPEEDVIDIMEYL